MFQSEVCLPLAPNTLYIVDDFIDGETKSENLTVCAFLFFCRCTVGLSMVVGHTSYCNICDIRFYPSFISRLIIDADLDRIKCIYGPLLADDWATELYGCKG